MIKRDERREEYDRSKLQRGLEHACVKRPVSAEAIGRLIDRVERELQESGEREVTSDYVGRRALEELSSIDVLAAVRFASVFLDFSRPDDYARFFAELPDADETGGPVGAGTAATGEGTVRSIGTRR